MNSSDTADLPKCISDELAALDQQREYALASVAIVIDAMTATADLGGEVGIWASTSPGAWVNIAITDGATIAEVRRRFARLGYRLSGTPRQYPEEKRVVHLLGNFDTAKIALNFKFPFAAGARCQFVEVGKKEVPVYELRCDGGAL